MMFKFTLLLIGAVLLIQSSDAIPNPPTETANETKSDNTIDTFGFKGIIERFKFLSIFIDEMFELQEIISSKTTKIFEQVLEDPKLYAANNETVEESLKKMREFVNDVKKDPKKTGSNLLEFLDDLGKTVTKFKINKNNESETIENVFNTLKSDVLNHFEKFSENFVKLLDSYIAELNEHEKKHETKLIAWLQKFKSEKDVKKQMDMFSDFFNDTDPEDSSSSESSE